MKQQLLSSSLAFLLFLGLASGAASPTLYQANEIEGNGLMRIKPQAAPTTTTILTTADAYVLQITMENPTAGALTFTATCIASGIAFVPAVSVAPNSLSVANYPAGYWCPGGFSVIASNTGLTYSAKWRQ